MNPDEQQQKVIAKGVTEGILKAVGILALLGVVVGPQSVLFIGVMTMMGAQENHFFGALGIMWLLTLEGALIGLVISALASSPEKALYTFPLALIPQLLLAGLFIPVQKPEKVYMFPEVEGRQGPPLTDETNRPKRMQPLLQYAASPGRWGLEALCDLYVHDYEKYSYLILDGVTISLHSGEFRRGDRHLNALGNSSSPSPEMPTRRSPPIWPCSPCSPR